MKYLNFIIVSMFVFFTTSCYEDFEKDFETTYTYFASQKPLRTLVADADMSIKVGVAFAGKREVNPNDWATFQIDNTLLDNYPDLELMPEKYYQLADKEKMTVTNPNLAIADVEVTFSDEFYNDNAALNKYYATDLGIAQIKNNIPEFKSYIVLENIVYNELINRDYEVYIGKTKSGEIDFIAKKDGTIKYIQVTYEINGNENAIKREFEALEKLKDNYPKYVISLDKINLSRNGIIHLNLIDFLLKDNF